MNGKSRMVAGAIVAVALVGITLVFAAAAPAYAYSVADGTSASGASSTNFGGLLTPVQDFFQSINSVGNSSFEPSMPSNSSGASGLFSSGQSSLPQPPTDLMTSATQGALQQFDNWFYGIAGFHIIGLLDTLLTIISWLLGIVTGIVNWLLKVLGGTH